MQERRVVSFNYTLTNKAGELLDRSVEGQPLLFLEGSGMIIEGLERALLKMKAGETSDVIVRPEDGYGFRDESLIDKVSKSQLPVEEVSVGDYFQAGSDRHSPVVQVVAVEGDDVTLDANHPLAGQDLFFAVEVTENRLATAEELDHGHAHQGGGDCGHGCGCEH